MLLMSYVRKCVIYSFLFDGIVFECSQLCGIDFCSVLFSSEFQNELYSRRSVFLHFRDMFHITGIHFFRILHPNVCELSSSTGGRMGGQFVGKGGGGRYTP